MMLASFMCHSRLMQHPLAYYYSLSSDEWVRKGSKGLRNSGIIPRQSTCDLLAATWTQLQNINGGWQSSSSIRNWMHKKESLLSIFLNAEEKQKEDYEKCKTGVKYQRVDENNLKNLLRMLEFLVYRIWERNYTWKSILLHYGYGSIRVALHHWRIISRSAQANLHANETTCFNVKRNRERISH